MTYDLDLLVDAWLENRLTPDETAQLLALVRNNPEAEKSFLANIYTNFLLEEAAATNQKEDYYFQLQEHARRLRPEQELHGDDLFDSHYDPFDQIHSAPRMTRVIQADFPFVDDRARRWFSPFFFVLHRRHQENDSRAATGLGRRLFLGAVCLLVVFGLSWSISGFFSVKEDASFSAMACVTETVDAVWSDGTEKYRRGQYVESSTFDLTAGFAQLEMNNGTTVIMRGPAKVTLDTAMQVTCSGGEVSVHVSKAAHGFTVATPDGLVVDHGTEFFVGAAQGETQVYVINGKVDFKSRLGETIPLATDQGVCFDSAIHECRNLLTFDSTKYMDQETFEKRVQAQASRQRAEQEEVNRALASDSNLLVHLVLNEGAMSRLANRALSGPDIQSRLLGGTTTGGPVAGTSALSFRKPTDGIAFEVPGKYETLVLEETIRVPEKPQPSNVLLASEEFLNQSGYLLWQITDRGILNLQVSGESGRPPLVFESTPSANLVRRGTWITVRAVINIPERKITQSIDGHVVDISTWRGPDTVQIGSAVLGNVATKKKGATLRNFCGVLSEFKLSLK